MDSKVMIEVKDVCIKFNMSSEKVDSIKEYFIRLAKGNLFYKEFQALQNVSLTINKGEVFGLVGFNGAGKSTLLKVIAGVLKPNSGSIKINGTIAPLIELGAGLNFDLTGRENIFLNGAVLGYSKKFMQEKYQDILDFSELDSFIDVPIKNYSSGMIARLAFSIATVVKPDILIVDEVLSVGDARFQQKCMDRINEMLNGDTTVIFVSHSNEQVAELCNRVAWLEKGQIKEIGETNEVIERYKSSY